MRTIIHSEPERIAETIMACDICFVAMADTDGTPYVLPMNFGFRDGIVYLHSGREGRKLRILERNPQVCLSFCSARRLVYQHPDVACSYSMSAESVIAHGSVVFEEDYDKKVEALRIIMSHYSEKTFDFNPPAVRNVQIWLVSLENMSCKTKEFGVSSKSSPR
ncbi:MAG: pyridoxamine 5'-phosphate oxidase family protein [Tannerellaceae bacterium]|jgi:nitroimidazol reductase NimA-like FMN-containing flavoprotein (pyridoxamine 5'-phosphate oxidase superfamily)|nr:pyridoxamine 5'-phosphate oxidase family protein [Tannerellaceae bacterium]